MALSSAVRPPLISIFPAGYAVCLASDVMGSNMTPEQARKLSLAEQNEWFRRATSRRNLLRGGIAASAAAAGSAILGGTANAATAKAATPDRGRLAGPQC